MIDLQVRPSADRLYYVLSHLDTGRDAASLFDRTLPPAGWAPALRRAYLADPQRLRIQFLPLQCRDLPAMEALLPTLPVGPALREALLASLGAVDPAPSVLPETTLPARLQPLRERLWADTGRRPPPLSLVHCAHLRGYARAMQLGRDRRIVAASLDEPPDRALMQIVHEECHPLSDPTVRADLRGRDTRAGSSGYAAHQALEEAAVRLQTRLIREHAPDLWPAHVAWCRNYGIRVR